MAIVRTGEFFYCIDYDTVELQNQLTALFPSWVPTISKVEPTENGRAKIHIDISNAPDLTLADIMGILRPMARNIGKSDRDIMLSMENLVILVDIELENKSSIYRTVRYVSATLQQG